MNELPHVMILASAGSGKTRALTNRYIALLARGAAPDRIAALTFTRKAAGEFFERIMRRLADAVADPIEARRLDGDIEWKDGGSPDYRGLLRQMVASMPRLRLGTLDGFFARIVRSFPFELGLTGDFELLEEYASGLERRRILRRLFLAAPGGVGGKQREFIEAFKRASFGTDEKRPAARLDDYLDQHHEIFLAASFEELWGDAARIWPDGNPWIEAKAELEPAIRRLRGWLAGAGMEQKQQRRWLDFLDAAQEWLPGTPLPPALTYLLGKALDALPDLSAGNAVLTIERKPQELAGEPALALAQAALALSASEIACRLDSTRGLRAVLSGYEAVYHDGVRRGGKLTFADVQRLLEPVRLSSGSDGAGDGRLSIDYRLDGQIDHWLLDEFQDTNFGQWSILGNLVDEAVQDPSGSRTFFCVGDVKQAIFAWRGGDPRLFREVIDRYSAAAPTRFSARRLDCSWRSGPPIIDLVNTVFGARGVLAGLFPGEASATWNAEWSEHRTAVPDRGGHAALLEAPDEAGRWRTTLLLLQELAPFNRGLTCAILVQSNDTATELTDYLRAEGALPAFAESDLRVCVDNPLGAALLALVQAAAHPGDGLAWQHLRMTPLRAILADDHLDVADALSVRILTEIARDGFARTMAAWLRRLEEALPAGDRFSRERGRQFVAAAEAFDGTGSRNPAEFVQYMKGYTMREPGGAGIIRVMTIHKAKGLDFDLVIVPDLEGQTLAHRREGLAIKKARDRSVEWIFDAPSKLFSERDPVLQSHLRDAEAAACYERLSLLYVALTRAKRGLYAITQPVGRSRSANFPRLLAATLGSAAQPMKVGGLDVSACWMQGDPDWHRECSPGPAPQLAPEWRRLPEEGLERSARPAARRASGRDEPIGLASARLFRLGLGKEAEFGLQVHALLAQVEWADPSRGGELARAWAGKGPAGAEAAACLLAEELQEVWMRPAQAAEVWRERAFEVMLDGVWVSGAFDRVVLIRDAAGRLASAALYDFKTVQLDERGEAAAAPYADQMETYRRAIQALTGLGPSAICSEIVFTRLRTGVRCPP